MNEPQIDCRIRRKKAPLLIGLMNLMETENIRNIPDKDFSTLVHINNNTFYLHYNNSNGLGI